MSEADRASEVGSLGSDVKNITKGKWGQLDKVVEEMITKLKRREIRGSSRVATQTAELLRTVVTHGSFRNVKELLDMIRHVGRALQSGNPIELAIGNITRRVLYIVRQECMAILKDSQSPDANNKEVDLAASMHKLFEDSKGEELDRATTSSSMLSKVKDPIREEINLLIDEVKTAHSNIADQAVEHIHAREVILTYGVSKTVLEFFKEARKLRNFEVVVAESAPSYSGHEMALKLAALDIEVTVITDSAVYAMIPAVNKVIVGTHVVMANGGLVAHTGAHNIAVVAKAHSVPFVVVTGLYKLCPLYAFDQDSFNELNSPADVFDFEEDFVEKVDVQNPAFDYVPPNLISLFITNFGGHNPSYVYRLLAEYYNPSDYEL